MKSIQIILSIMKKYLWVLLLVIVLSLMISGMGLLGPYYLSEIVECYGQGEFRFSLIQIYGILLLGGKLLDNVHGFLVSWYNRKAIELIRLRADEWLLKRRKFGKMPFDGGGIVSRMTSDTDAVTQLLASPLNGLIPEALTGIGALIMLWRIHWGIAILTMVTLPAFYYTTKWVNRVSREIAQTNGKVRASMTSYFMDFVKNYRMYVCYDGREEEQKRSAWFCRALTNSGMRQSAVMTGYFTFIAILRCGVVFLSLWILFSSIRAGKVSAGAVIMVVSYVQNAFSPVFQLSRYVNQVAQADVALQRVFDLEPKEADCVGEFAEAKRVSQNRLCVEDLCLVYEGAWQEAVKNVSFAVQGTGLLCLYGSSGSGKSTLLHALCGLMPVSAGRIRYNGEDYTDRMLELVLQKKIRIVFQESCLFDRSLSENLLYGARADWDVEQFYGEFGNKLGLDALLEKTGSQMQNGLDGDTVSGGEKRRLALLRGLNQEADIYLFDEPTSELDEESAAYVRDLIRKLKRRAIVVISTHDAGFKAFADQVVAF